jgi:hypothetical protein
MPASPISSHFQGLNPKFAAGNELRIFVPAGGTLGIPGRPIQSEDERAGRTLQLCRYSGYMKLGPFGKRLSAHKIEVPLDPFIIKISDFPDFQVDGDDSGGLVATGVVQSDLQNTLSYGEFMHRVSSSPLFFSHGAI